MRETELRARMAQHLGSAYSLHWAENQSMASLGGRTVEEALVAGVNCKTIWRAVWAELELAPVHR
ncbi:MULTISPECIES: DUF3046 domain-containing protein [Aestuariimicrobium]|uniref:DUF3046 domain-containing protein n=1 Tax=Aestuariimicrobium TaxID=396388 RepID=UPI0003B323EC|nr:MULTISPECIES: DUF3046 domain-containing protein [Aestuariimicrobium]